MTERTFTAFFVPFCFSFSSWFSFTSLRFCPISLLLPCPTGFLFPFWLMSPLLAVLFSFLFALSFSRSRLSARFAQSFVRCLLSLFPPRDGAGFASTAFTVFRPALLFIFAGFQRLSAFLPGPRKKKFSSFAFPRGKTFWSAPSAEESPERSPTFFAKLFSGYLFIHKINIRSVFLFFFVFLGGRLSDV